MIIFIGEKREREKLSPTNCRRECYFFVTHHLAFWSRGTDEEIKVGTIVGNEIPKFP